MPTKDDILAAIEPIQDPEMMIGIVDLGLIRDVIFKDSGHVHICMTLTTPACPYGPELIDGVQKTTAAVEGVERATVELVWNPPWNPAKMATERGKDLMGIW